MVLFISLCFFTMFSFFLFCFFFFFNDTATTETYTLSLHDALPIRNQAPSATDPKNRMASQGSTGPMDSFRSVERVSGSVSDLPDRAGSFVIWAYSSLIDDSPGAVSRRNSHSSRLLPVQVGAHAEDEDEDPVAVDQGSLAATTSMLGDKAGQIARATNAIGRSAAYTGSRARLPSTPCWVVPGLRVLATLVISTVRLSQIGVRIRARWNPALDNMIEIDRGEKKRTWVGSSRFHHRSPKRRSPTEDPLGVMRYRIPPGLSA